MRATSLKLLYVMSAVLMAAVGCGGDDNAGDGRPQTPSTQLRLLAGHYGGPGHADGPSDVARFARPVAVVVDTQGNRYVSDRDWHVIRRISPDGEVATIAGKPAVSGAADGTGNLARFNLPTGLALDGQGSLYVADYGNHLIRKVRLADGEVTTVAGTAGTEGSDAGGNGFPATLRQPIALAWRGSELLIVERGNHVIRRLVAPQSLLPLAGLVGQFGDALTEVDAQQARFTRPTGITVDPANGDVYVMDTGNCVVRRIREKLVTIVAGVNDECDEADGPLGVGHLWVEEVPNPPVGIIFDSAGRLIVVDSQGLRAISSIGELSTLKPTAPEGDNAPTPLLPHPNWLSGIAKDRDGRLLIADTARGLVLSVELSGASEAILRTVAGQRSGSGAPVLSEKVGDDLLTVAAGRDGSLLLSGDGTHRVMPSGEIDHQPGGLGGQRVSAVAEATNGMLFALVEPEFPVKFRGHFEGYREGERKFSIPFDSIPFEGAELWDPVGLAIDGQGRAIIVDQGFGTVSRVDQQGTLTRIAGRKHEYGKELGDALEVARFQVLMSVAAAKNGDILLLERNHQSGLRRLLRITPVNGRDVVSLIAENEDIGDATTLAVDANDNIYLWRVPDCTVLRIRPNGERKVIAGQARQCSFKSGPAPGMVTATGGRNSMAVVGDRLVMLMDKNAVVEIGPLSP